MSSTSANSSSSSATINNVNIGQVQNVQGTQLAIPFVSDSFLLNESKQAISMVGAKQAYSSLPKMHLNVLAKEFKRIKVEFESMDEDTQSVHMLSTYQALNQIGYQSDKGVSKNLFKDLVLGEQVNFLNSYMYLLFHVVNKPKKVNSWLFDRSSYPAIVRPVYEGKPSLIESVKTFFKKKSMWYSTYCDTCKCDVCVCGTVARAQTNLFDKDNLSVASIVTCIISFILSFILKIFGDWYNPIFSIMSVLLFLFQVWPVVRNWAVTVSTNWFILRWARKVPDWVYWLMGASAVGVAWIILNNRRAKKHVRKVVNQANDKKSARMEGFMYIFVTLIAAAGAVITSDSKYLRIVKSFMEMCKISSICNQLFGGKQDCCVVGCSRKVDDCVSKCSDCAMKETLDLLPPVSYKSSEIIMSPKRYMIAFITQTVNLDDDSVVIPQWWAGLSKTAKDLLAGWLHIPAKIIDDHTSLKPTIGFHARKSNNLGPDDLRISLYILSKNNNNDNGSVKSVSTIPIQLNNGSSINTQPFVAPINKIVEPSAEDIRLNLALAFKQLTNLKSKSIFSNGMTSVCSSSSTTKVVNQSGDYLRTGLSPADKDLTYDELVLEYGDILIINGDEVRFETEFMAFTCTKSEFEEIGNTSLRDLWESKVKIDIQSESEDEDEYKEEDTPTTKLNNLLETCENDAKRPAGAGLGFVVDEISPGRQSCEEIEEDPHIVHNTQGGSWLQKIIGCFGMSKCKWTVIGGSMIILIISIACLYLYKRRVVDENADVCIHKRTGTPCQKKACSDCSDNKVVSEGHGNLGAKRAAGAAGMLSSTRQKHYIPNDDEEEEQRDFKLNRKQTQALDLKDTKVRYSNASNKPRNFIVYGDADFSKILSDLGSVTFRFSDGSSGFRYQVARSKTEYDYNISKGGIPIVTRDEYANKTSTLRARGVNSLQVKDVTADWENLSKCVKNEPMSFKDFSELCDSAESGLLQPKPLVAKYIQRWLQHDEERENIYSYIYNRHDLPPLKTDNNASSSTSSKNESVDCEQPVALVNESILAHHKISADVRTGLILKVEKCIQTSEGEHWKKYGVGLLGVNCGFTAEHVVREASDTPSRFRLTNWNGSEIYNVVSTDVDYEKDFALLKFSTEDLKKMSSLYTANKIRTRNAKIGDRLIISHFTDNGVVNKEGVCAGLETVKDEDGRDLTLFQATYESVKGDSGGPVFCLDDGCLVGFHLKGSAEKGKYNYFSPVPPEFVGYQTGQSVSKTKEILKAAKNSLLNSQGSTSVGDQ